MKLHEHTFHVNKSRKVKGENSNLNEHIAHTTKSEVKGRKSNLKEKEPQKTKCAFCDFNFESPDSISHIYRCDKRKGKTEKKKLDKQCPVCFFEAQTKQNLEKHVVGQHAKVKYLCEVCNKQFSRKELKVQHIREKHENVEKPFKCEKCQSRFGTRALLRKHDEKHDKTPKICSLCKSQYTFKGDLSKHLKKYMVYGLVVIVPRNLVLNQI